MISGTHYRGVYLQLACWPPDGEGLDKSGWHVGDGDGSTVLLEAFGRGDTFMTWNGAHDWVDSLEPDMPRDPRHVCRVCGVYEFNMYEPVTKARLAALSLCHGCDFWLEHIDDMRAYEKAPKREPGAVLVQGGVFYRVGEAVGAHYRGFTGFGGSRFVIEWPDGSSLETSNMWSNGRVPNRFREQLPDTAVVRSGARVFGGPVKMIGRYPLSPGEAR